MYHFNLLSFLISDRRGRHCFGRIVCMSTRWDIFSRNFLLYQLFAEITTHQNTIFNWKASKFAQIGCFVLQFAQKHKIFKVWLLHFWWKSCDLPNFMKKHPKRNIAWNDEPQDSSSLRFVATVSTQLLFYNDMRFFRFLFNS